MVTLTQAKRRSPTYLVSVRPEKLAKAIELATEHASERRKLVDLNEELGRVDGSGLPSPEVCGSILADEIRTRVEQLASGRDIPAGAASLALQLRATRGGRPMVAPPLADAPLALVCLAALAPDLPTRVEKWCVSNIATKPEAARQRDRKAITDKIENAERRMASIEHAEELRELLTAPDGVAKASWWNTIFASARNCVVANLRESVPVAPTGKDADRGLCKAIKAALALPRSAWGI